MSRIYWLNIKADVISERMFPLPTRSRDVDTLLEFVPDIKEILETKGRLKVGKELLSKPIIWKSLYNYNVQVQNSHKLNKGVFEIRSEFLKKFQNFF